MAPVSSWRAAAQTAIQILLVLALFASLQFLVGRRNVRFDLTPTQRFTLSPYARQAAEAFDGKATVYAFYDSQQVAQRQQLLDLLDQIHAHAPHLDYELIDLDRKPGLAKKFEVSSYGSGVLELEDGTRHPLRAVTEEGLTASLLRLSRDDTGTVCFLTGHGEADPRDTAPRGGLSKLTQAIEQEGFAVGWELTIGRDGPDQRCTVIVSASPSHDLASGEAESIEEYVRGGGRLLLLLDPGAPPSFDELVGRFGLLAGRNVIVDESNRMVGADSFVPQVDRFRPDVFEDRLRAAVILPLARTIRTTGDEGTKAISLAATSESSWAHVDATEVPSQDVTFRPTIDEPGPLSIAAQATVATDDANDPGIIIAVGDSDFATNVHLDTLGNRDFFLALVGVLARDASLIGMRREDEGNPERPLVLTASQTSSIFWVGVVIVPGLSVLAGMVLAGLRNRRRGGR